ncbi:HAMP domain-containing sensor histidine kinase [uncultured Roseivirga sp.]|uniref:sensor histidine kinase n=1 Tax=uncultured Roseivirga sp. TaxID=543088 RepID=UPI0030DA9E2B
MLFNSKAVALLLASVVGLITTAFLSLVSEIPVQALIIGGLISFAATYIFAYVTFEFLVFKEISRIYEVLNKIRKKNFSFIEEEEERKHLNPLKRINQEIYTYAAGRQREIEELKKVEAFRREFLADVSHELKTPVFAAQGFVHTLLDGAIDDSKVRIKFLKRAAKSLDSLDALIHDLLTLSQIELGETKMHFEHFNINEMANEVLDQFENKVERKGLYIGFDQEYNHPIFVYADSEKIYRVLTNLVSNANKYTDEGEIILGFSVSSGGHVTVSVRDTGMGIPPEDLSRVFERFFRVEKSRSKGRKGGTGLGLAIVKHIMEAHNSKVSVISTFGKGSTFSFKLPLSKEEDLDSTDDDEFESED